MSGQSNGSQGGSAESFNLSDLMKGDLPHEQRQKEVGAGGTDGDDSVHGMSGDNLDNQSGRQENGGDRGSDDIRDLAERLLDASEKARSDQGNAAEKGDRLSSTTDDRERPAGLTKDQRTLAMVAEDVDIDTNDLYGMMVPLNDGTGRYVSVEALKEGYIGTDADTLSKGRAELSQQHAAFEVQKTEHEQAVVRGRKEISDMMGLLRQHLPPAAIEGARAEAQRRMAEAAADILERFPAWRDPKVAAAWQGQASKVLAKYGFSRAEATAISDARLLALVDMHVKLLDFADKVKNPKTVQKRPRKSDVRPQRKGVPVEKVAAAVDRAKAPGASREDKIKGVMALLGNFPL